MSSPKDDAKENSADAPSTSADEGATGNAAADHDESSNSSLENTMSEPRKGKIDSSVEAIRLYIAEKLGFIDSEEKKPAEAEKPVLDEPTVDGIVKYIKDGKCKRIITMAGAGISTSAGIPDFRSPGSGLYHNLEKYNLPDPQAIFEIGFFKKNPQPFFTLAKELYPGCFKPTICHYFVRLLHQKGLLLRHYTQNIDTLERVSGLDGDMIVEAHGTFHTSRCLSCKKVYTMEWMKERIFADVIPVCAAEGCKGVVKPDIVFFGENLPERFHKLLYKDFPECDLLIIMGSSLAVQPFASLTDRVDKKCPRLLINREKCGQRDKVMNMLKMGSGLDYDNDGNTRDVAWLGDCDDGCKMLADKLGWGEELKELITAEHNKIDEKMAAEKKLQEKKKKLPQHKEKEVKTV